MRSLLKLIDSTKQPARCNVATEAAGSHSSKLERNPAALAEAVVPRERTFYI